MKTLISIFRLEKIFVLKTPVSQGQHPNCGAADSAAGGAVVRRRLHPRNYPGPVRGGPGHRHCSLASKPERGEEGCAKASEAVFRARVGHPRGGSTGIL